MLIYIYIHVYAITNFLAIFSNWIFSPDLAMCLERLIILHPQSAWAWHKLAKAYTVICDNCQSANTKQNSSIIPDDNGTQSMANGVISQSLPLCAKIGTEDGGMCLSEGDAAGCRCRFMAATCYISAK